MTNSEKIIANNEKIASITKFLEDNSIDQILDITENGKYKTKRVKEVNVKVRSATNDVISQNFATIKSLSIMRYAINKEPRIATDEECDLVNSYFTYWSKIHLGE